MIGRLVDTHLCALRYGAASMVALGVDLALFVAGLDLGLGMAAASALGYGVGIAVHWFLSVYMEVPEGAMARPAARHRQAVFLSSALLGLGITVALIAYAGRLGLDPRLAKLIAVAFAAHATWLLRRNTVEHGIR